MTDKQVVPVGPLKTGEVTWEVTFGTQGHYFTAKAPGFSPCLGTNWDELETACKTAASRAKTRVEVQYARMDWTGSVRKGDYRPVWVYGTGTSVHAANGNVMIREGGISAQAEGYGASKCIMPPSPEDAQELLQLSARVREMENRRSELLRKYAFPEGSLKAQVQHEIEQAREKAQEGGSQ
jgi:hypothetical protein